MSVSFFVPEVQFIRDEKRKNEKDVEKGKSLLVGDKFQLVGSIVGVSGASRAG